MSTVILLLTSVRSPVYGQVGAVGEPPLTELARVRLGVTVLLFVNPKRSAV